MSTLTNPVFDAALALPQSERIELAERLLESLDHEIPIELSEEWRIELRRRMEDYKAGKLTTVSAQEALAKARKVLQ